MRPATQIRSVGPNPSFELTRRPVTQFAVANWAPVPRASQLDRLAPLGLFRELIQRLDFSMRTFTMFVLSCLVAEAAFCATPPATTTSSAPRSAPSQAGPSPTCPKATEDACLLAELFATEMSRILTERTLGSDEIRMESVKATGPIVNIVMRTTYTESELKKTFADSARPISEYVDTIRSANLQLDCRGAARDIVARGGSIVTTTLFKDGCVLDEQTVSFCL